jgi:heat shock protein HslJ
MKKILLSMTILSCLFSLTNCNNTKQLTSQTEALFRKNWRLIELNGMQVSDSVRSRFEFTPGRISGSTGCNNLSAGFTAGKNQTVKFSEVAMTRMACADETAMALETKFTDALSKSVNWDIKGSELWLGDGGGTLIKLKSF